MSVWYHYDIEALATDTVAIAKFFDLSKEDVRIDNFSFSFGAKNAAGLRIRTLMAKHPGLIFLVQEQIECETCSWWIERYIEATDKFQYVFLYTDGPWERKINKKILEEYEKEFPSLPAKHIARQEGYENFRWSMFFSFNRADRILNNADEYKERISIAEPDEYQESDDYSHLEGE